MGGACNMRARNDTYKYILTLVGNLEGTGPLGRPRSYTKVN